MSDQSSDNNSVKMGSDGIKFVSDQVDQALKQSFSGQKKWSAATHGATICVAVFSAVAAVLAQVDANSALSGVINETHAKNAATVLSLFVTILTTIQAKLGFERKWIANRMTHSALNLLFIDEKTGTNPTAVRDKLKEILGAHDKAITDAAAS